MFAYFQKKKRIKSARLAMLAFIGILFTLGIFTSLYSGELPTAVPKNPVRPQLPTDADSTPNNISGTAMDLYTTGSSFGYTSTQLWHDEASWAYESGTGTYAYNPSTTTSPLWPRIQFPDTFDWSVSGMDLEISQLQEVRDWTRDISGTSTPYPSYNYNTEQSSWYTSWALAPGGNANDYVIYTYPFPGDDPQFRLEPAGRENEELLTNRILDGANGGYNVPTGWSLGYSGSYYGTALGWSSYFSHPTNAMDTHHVRQQTSGCCDYRCDESGGIGCNEYNSDYNGANSGARGWRSGSRDYRLYSDAMSTSQSAIKTGSGNYDWQMTSNLRVNGYAYTQKSDICHSVAETEFDVTRSWTVRMYQQVSNSWFLNRKVDELSAYTELAFSRGEQIIASQGGTHSQDFSYTGEMWLELRNNLGQGAAIASTSFSSQNPPGTRIILSSSGVGDIVEFYKGGGGVTTWDFSIFIRLSYRNEGDARRSQYDGDAVAEKSIQQWGIATIRGGSTLGPSLKMTYSKDFTSGTGARTFTTDIPWEGRKVTFNESTRPTITFHYDMEEVEDSASETNELTGASLAVFLKNHAGTERVIYSTDYSIENVQNSAGDASIQLTDLDIQFLDNAGDTIQIGVGVHVHGTFRMFRKFPTRTTPIVTFSNIHFQMRTVPLPEQVNLQWSALNQDNDPIATESIDSGTGLHDGTGESSRTQYGYIPTSGPLEDIPRYRFTHQGVNVTFVYKIIVPIELQPVHRTFSIDYAVGYDQTSITTSYFTGTKVFPDPSVTVITSDYSENTNLNVTLPKYQIAGSNEWYWNMTQAIVSGIYVRNFTLSNTYGVNDPSWTDRDRYVGRWLGGTGDYAQCQVLYFEPELLERPSAGNRWTITLQFAAPNEIDAASVTTSKDPSFASSNSVFLTDEDLNTRTTLANTQTSGPTTTATAHLEAYNSSGDSIYHNSKILGGAETYFEFINDPPTEDTWVINATNGQGPGFWATSYYVGTINLAFAPVGSGFTSFTGVMRAGFGRQGFEINRRTQATLYINGTRWDEFGVPTIVWDTNVDLGMLNLSVVWEDISNQASPRPITYDDGFGVITARSAIAEWENYENQKRAVDIDTLGWTPMGFGGTTMIGENEYRTAGTFTVYADPLSVANPSGNMTQGYHNFTISLEREGFQSQTFSSNFSIALDTFLEVILPQHQTGGSANDSYPHFMEDGAQAGKGFDIQATLRHRGSYFGAFPGELVRLAGGNGRFFEDMIHINYTLVKLGYYDPFDDSNFGELYWNYGMSQPRVEADWSLVNTSWCAEAPEKNYHNGTLAPFDSSGIVYTVNLTYPVYEHNSAGYGKDVNGGETITAYYNFTYWVETNYTIEYDDVSGLVKNTFQPVTVSSIRTSDIGDTMINGSCERPSDFPNAPAILCDADYDGDWDTALYGGRAREEWIRIMVHPEGSGNMTMLSLYNSSFIRYKEGETWVEIDPQWYNTNASDCGWAFNMTGSIFDTHDLIDGTITRYKNPGDPEFNVVQYWKNLTTYPYTSEYFPSSDLSSGVEQRLNNQTQQVRFRVIYNSTWSDFAELNYGFFNEPMWSDGDPLGFDPRCGPLSAAMQYGWDGPAELTLTGWGADPIIMLPDSDTFFSWQVKNFTWAGLSPGDQLLYSEYEWVTVVGNTWVTPWLNLTEKAAGVYTGRDGLEIEARKRGFYPARLTINLDILPQKTSLYNYTTDAYGTNTSIVVDGETGVSTDFHFNVRWNKVVSFKVNFTDITNVLTHGFDPVTGATISVPNLQADNTDGNLFYYNEGGAYWSYTEEGNGIYEINILDTGFQNLTDFSTFDIELTFRIGSSNYSSIDFNLMVTVEKRNMMMNLINSTILRGTYLDPAKYNPAEIDLSNPYYQELTITFELLDLHDSYNPISLSNYATGGTEIDDFFDFALLTVGDIVQFTQTGRIRYNVTIHTGIAIGWHQLQMTIQTVPNYYSHANNSVNFEIMSIPVEHLNLTTSVVEYSYLQFDENEWTTNYASFSFKILDQYHSSLLGPLINDSTSRILTAEVSTDWENSIVTLEGYGSHWTLSSAGDDSPDPQNIGGFSNVKIYDYTYTIRFNTTGMDARTTPYQVQVNIAKANHDPISFLLNFTIKEAETDLYLSELNNEEIVNSAGNLRYETDDEIVIPWSQELTMKVGWGYLGDLGQKWAIENRSTINPLSLSVGNWFAGKVGSWQVDFGSDEYSFFIVTLQTDIDGFALPQNRLVTFTLSCANFEDQAITLNLTIRNRKVELRMIEDIELSLQTFDLAYEIRYGENFSLGFEFKDGETSTNLITPLTGTKSLDELIIMDHNVPEEVFNFVGQGFQIPASFDYVPIEELDGLHHYYLVNLGTNTLSVRETPYQLTINLTRSHYDLVERTLNITVNKQSIKMDSIIQSQGGSQVIDVFEDKFFSFVIILVDPVSGERMTYDEFTVTYQMLKIGEDGTYTAQDWENSSGTLEWNPETRYYILTLPVSDDMRGGFRVVFTITSKSGNYESITGTVVLLFQEPPSEITLQSLILLAASILMVVGVGSFVGVKAWQLRIPFVLRMIDESIKKITDNKYPSVGVMKARREFIVESIIDRLEDVGIKWDITEKFSIDEIKAGKEDTKAPFTEDEIREELAKIVSLTEDERMLFVEELKRLKRNEQEEFLDSIKEG